MRKIDDVLAYARKLGAQLESDMTTDTSERSSGWKAIPPATPALIDARGTAALEFFRQYAGSESVWTQRAEATYQQKKKFSSVETAVRAIAPLLQSWADQVDAGIVEVAGWRTWTEVGLASTDIMGQVRRLLEEPNTHPAAPIVLCGAALEIALRGLADVHGVQQPPKPSLSKLTTALRSANVITVQDVKDLEQCGGIRNSAAHGDFAALSRERAGLMEQQTNLLLRRISDMHP